MRKALRMNIKRRGGDMWTINEEKIKKHFVFSAGSIYKDKYENRAKNILMHVFNVHIRMRYLTARTIELLIHM
jgi:hypothetical protein